MWWHDSHFRSTVAHDDHNHSVNVLPCVVFSNIAQTESDLHPDVQKGSQHFDDAAENKLKVLKWNVGKMLLIVIDHIDLGPYYGTSYDISWDSDWSRSSRYIPANTTHWNNIGLMLGQRRRRWAKIKPTLFQWVVFDEIKTWTGIRDLLVNRDHVVDMNLKRKIRTFLYGRKP